MPIEIKELIIKASVGAGGAGAGGGDQATSTSNNSVSPSEELVNTCVEKILEILKEKNER
jgi:Family of unknown function (DUF5908)